MKNLLNQVSEQASQEKIKTSFKGWLRVFEVDWGWEIDRAFQEEKSMHKGIDL